jgi:hypothetical protein
MEHIKKQFPTLILLLGKSKSGKSHLTKYLLQYYTLEKPIWQFGLCLTGSPYNHEYTFLPDHAVHEYNEDILESYINELKTRKDESKGEKMPASFLILDDCLGLISKTAAWQNLLSTYRHLNITIFLSVQYLKTEASSTLVREQAGIVCAFKSTNINVINCLYDYFGSELFESVKDFKARYSACTSEKYHCMLYIADDALSSSNKNFLSFTAPKELLNVKLKY